jgi:voltage-gated potassium channel
MIKRFILIGYGDVGHSIASVLKDSNLSFMVIDKNEAKIKDKGFDYASGDATDEELLNRAGVKDASTIIIVLNNDDDIIFTTLIARNLNPHCIIIARANAMKSIDKIYRAGANYVASLSIVAGQMLAHMALDHEWDTIMMFEGLEIARYPVTRSSSIIDKSISEAKIRSRIGCTIIGIEENGKTTTDFNPSTILREGMTLAIIGNREQISRFKEKYVESL